MAYLPTLPVLLLVLLGAAPARAQIVAQPDSLAHAVRVAEFQRTLNHEFANPAESPLTAAKRAQFQELPYYPAGYRYCVTARLVRDTLAQFQPMATSTDRLPLYRRYGTLHFTLGGRACTLAVFQSLNLLSRPGFADYLFLPFTDDTNGHGSYGGGRYLDLRLPPPGSAVLELDFNRAYNPSCAYNHTYSCPVPPAENRLSLAVEAGVREPVDEATH